MSKLKWSWGERDGDLIIRKSRGKITFDELFRFMHESDQINAFDGDLMVIQFRVSDQHDMYDYVDEVYGEPEGDTLEVQFVTDDSPCPCCGENRIFPAYCPDCGRKLIEKR